MTDTSSSDIIIEEGHEEVMFVGSSSSNTNVSPEGFIADPQTRLSQTKNGSIRMHSIFLPRPMNRALIAANNPMNDAELSQAQFNLILLENMHPAYDPTVNLIPKVKK